MKNAFTIVSTLVIGITLTLSACGKDKKPATTEPANAEPAATAPAKTEPAAAAPKADDKPKVDDKGGGW